MGERWSWPGGRQTTISDNLIYGLFMYFCIYLDIPELESWVIAELHAPALARCRLSLAAGYLPTGLQGKGPAPARRVLPVGNWGLVSVSLGSSLRAWPGLLLQRQR